MPPPRGQIRFMRCKEFDVKILKQPPDKFNFEVGAHPAIPPSRHPAIPPSPLRLLTPLPDRISIRPASFHRLLRTLLCSRPVPLWCM